MADLLSGELPVGSVLAYIGTNPVGLRSSGWLLCDGSYLARTEYPELFAAIGTANGAPDQSTFNLPDCRGYFLRGTDLGTKRDPDANARTAPRQGANSGDKVGSVQGYATAEPTTKFTAGVPHLPDGDHRAYKGSTVKISSRNNGSVDVTTTGGGDHETRPMNRYVFYIIKARSTDDSGGPVDVPVGTVVPFAGANTADIQNNYLLCDGRSITNTGVYQKLYEAIETSQGGDGKPNFNIPDYRGYFLRGVAQGQLTDPDSNQRTAPFPDRTSGKGNAGDQVGSVQGGATALPHNPFVSSVSHLPTGDYTSDTTLGRTSTYWNSGSVPIDVSSGGGDAETRPINIAVEWWVRF